MSSEGNKIQARHQKLSKVSQRSRMRWRGQDGVWRRPRHQAGPAQLQQREIYEALMERKCYCYLPPFSGPNSDLFSLPSHSILPFFTFNLDHPNGSITHVRLPPRDVCERGGCFRAAGWLFTTAAPSCWMCFEAGN